MCPKNTEILLRRTFFSQFFVRHQKSSRLFATALMQQGTFTRRR